MQIVTFYFQQTLPLHISTMIIVALLFAIAGAWWLYWSAQAKRMDRMTASLPSPPSVPVLGHALSFIGNAESMSLHLHIMNSFISSPYVTLHFCLGTYLSRQTQIIYNILKNRQVHVQLTPRQCLHRCSLLNYVTGDFSRSGLERHVFYTRRFCCIESVKRWNRHNHKLLFYFILEMLQNLEDIAKLAHQHKSVVKIWLGPKLYVGK